MSTETIKPKISVNETQDKAGLAASGGSAFVWPVCKHCHQSSKRLALLALMCDLGAKASPGPLACPGNGGGEHDFV